MPGSGDILDILPPIPAGGGVPWGWIALGAAAALAAAALLWRRLRKRPAPPPPSPRETALDALRDLAARAHETDSEVFAAEVSGVLRRFIGGQFGLRAEYQTTQEFLETANRSRIFPEAETALLAEFLAEADRLKFAGEPAATPARVNGRLLDLAAAFVRGEAL